MSMVKRLKDIVIFKNKNLALCKAKSVKFYYLNIVYLISQNIWDVVEFKDDIIMPAIYFSKRERIKKNEQNKAVDEMKRGKKQQN